METQLFGNMNEDEEFEYDHTLVDNSIAQDGDKENSSVVEKNSNMCKDVVIEMELMQLQVENDLFEDVELQRELQHALDVLIDEYEC